MAMEERNRQAERRRQGEYNGQEGRRQEKRRKPMGTVFVMCGVFLAVAAVACWGVRAILAEENMAAPPAVIGSFESEETAAGADQAASQGVWEETGWADDAGWNLILVNKWNPIPENYHPNLVEVTGGEQVDERIYEPLMEMLEAAKEGNAGQFPLVVSGYRTQEKQQSLYDEKIEEYLRQGYSQSEAAEQAKRWVAVPGYSEHQLGFAVDINGAVYDIYLWLQENSYKYGFIFRYPGNKTDITGVAEEVWHYRYVGVEAAAEIHERGISLEEYLEEKNSEKGSTGA